MLSKTKKLLFLTTGLAGALVVSSAAGVALSSCTVEAVNGGNNSSDGITLPDTWYNKDINWSDATSLNNLIIDKQGFVYSNKYKTEIIAILPGYESSTLVIPSTVTSITGYNNVTTTTNGETVTTIKTAKGAFEGLTSITNVKFAGKNITQIGPRAFYGCTSLQAISLPSSVNLIASEAFGSCSSLNTIDLSNIQYVGANAFKDAFTAVPYGSINLNLNKVVLIAAGAFQNALGVGSVDFSKNTTITQIAENAFNGCANLVGDIDLSTATKLITIGSTSIPSTTGSSFANTAITNVYLPSTLRTIAAQTFSGCTNLENVGPKGNTTGFTAVEGITGIHNKAFAGTKITSVNVSTTTSTTPLQNGAFSGMTNLTEVNLGSTITSIPAACFVNCIALTSLKLPSSITNIVGGSSTFANIVVDNNAAITTQPSISFNGDNEINYPPFYGSGITSIDLSTVTSYQTTSSNALNLPNTLFYNCPNLTTVTLKEGTTQIGEGSFALTPLLESVITEGSSNNEGYVAASSVSNIGQYAFWKSGISSVDLSSVNSSSFTTLSQATFADCQNLTSIKLPTNMTTINVYAITINPKLTTVNFDALTSLIKIDNYNFNKSLLTEINLSNTKIASIGVGSFISLPVSAQASFPTTLSDGFQNIFTTTSGSTIPFSFPNGINSGFFVTGSNANTATLSNSYVLQNIQTVTSGRGNVLRNTSDLNLSIATNVKSIGTNTFFGSNKLSSLTLNAKILASSNIHMFTASNTTTSNSDNKVDISSTTNGSYKTANVPFGNNELLKSINYTNFTTSTTYVESSNKEGEDISSQETLFNTTNNTTWTEVAKIINSLSYQASATSSEDAKNSKANMSNWDSSNNANNSPMNVDAASNFSSSEGSSSVTLNNSFIVNDDSNVSSDSNVVISNSVNTLKFIHNGITWTYTNDGSTIKLVGSVNMYKATKESNTSSSFLVFFNQSMYSDVTDTTTIYYVPNQTPINVTLTIATATSTNS